MGSGTHEVDIERSTYFGTSWTVINIYTVIEYIEP